MISTGPPGSSSAVGGCILPKSSKTTTTSKKKKKKKKKKKRTALSAAEAGELHASGSSSVICSDIGVTAPGLRSKKEMALIVNQKRWELEKRGLHSTA